MTMTRWLPLLLATPCGLAGQDVPVDAGTLLIRRNGELVAQEEFQVRREAGGVTVTSTARWGATARLVLAVYAPRRITVRVSSGSGEIAREFPARGVALLDDSSFVFLALLPRTGGEVRIARPGSGAGEPGTIRAEGDRVEVTTAAGTIRAWFDAEGRLLRAEIPGRNLEVARRPSP